jgi:splicing factor 1
MARDCRGRGDPNLAQNKQTAFDSEYSALMAELGEGGGAPGGAPGGRPAGAVTGGPGGPPPEPEQRIPPWRMPENWMPSMPSRSMRGQSLTVGTDQRPGGMAPPHAGFQQPYTQNSGYGYGGYRPEAGYPGAGAPGATDPYAA